MKKISFILGTRPEVIKLFPVIKAMQGSSEFSPHVCATGQHREMFYQAADELGIVPDLDLCILEPGQTLSKLTSKAITAIDPYISAQCPDMIIVQGDTTSAFCAALVAFYRGVRIGHVEAGLRTWDKYSPFPEETNRVLIGRIADLHFAPTETARANLLREGVDSKLVIVTGNTGIDSLLWATEKASYSPPDIPCNLGNEKRVVLVTTHRRENFNKNLENICFSIVELAKIFLEVRFVFMIHPNPNVKNKIERILGSVAPENITLTEPLSYLQFVWMMLRSCLIITDSGGVQEEAPSIGRPVLVVRDTTERTESVAEGGSRLIGADVGKIVNEVVNILVDGWRIKPTAVYGSGKASEKILDFLKKYDWDQRQ